MEETTIQQRRPGDGRNAVRLLGRVQSSLLAAMLIYKLLTVFLFMPFSRQIWKLALWLSPVDFITPSNAGKLLQSPFMLLGGLVIGVLSSCWALYQISLIICGLDRARRGEPCRILPLFRESARCIRRAVHPRNWLILIYAALLIPFTHFFISINYISQLKIPEYIMEVIEAKTSLYIVYLVIFVLLVLLSLRWILSFHYFIIEEKDFSEAARESGRFWKTHPIRKFLYLCWWNFRMIFRVVLPVILFFILDIAVLIWAGTVSSTLLRGLWRGILNVQIPVGGYVYDCLLTIFRYSILSAFYYRIGNEDFAVGKRLEDGSRYRKGGRLMLLAAFVITCGIWFGVSLLSVLPVFEQNNVFSSIRGARTQITSHRGYSEAAPENTIPAFEAAIQAGSDCAELDVQLTKDGVIVLTHDTNLQRCTGRNANVYDLDYSEIETLDAGSFFSEEFAGTRIPTLQEVIEYCRGKIRLNIEIKSSEQTPELEQKVAELIRAENFTDQCVVTSLSYASLVKVKEYAPEIRTGYIMPACIGSYYDLPAADFFSIEGSFVTAAAVQEIHARGKTISVWTVDRIESMKKMFALGVDDVITGKPAQARELQQEQKSMEDFLVELREAIADDSKLRKANADAPETGGGAEDIVP